MSRAGRKRKDGDRYPSGQLKKAKKAIRDTEATESQPHRHQLRVVLRKSGISDGDAAAFSRGEEAESPIGRLWASGLLALKTDADEQASRDRYDAGSMFAQVVGAYASSIEAPGGVSGSGQKSACQADLLCALDPDECLCFARRRRYMRAYEALAGGDRVHLELDEQADMPEPLRAAIAEAQRLREDEAYAAATDRRRTVMAVIKVVIHRETLAPEELVYLVSGLETLRQHFGLTTRRKRKQY